MLNFILAAANIFAYVIGVPLNRDVNVVRQVSNGIMLPKFTPKSLKVETNN